ncbi:hypothetical protein L873DRAFT_1076529 [Choiromyces venosus 120613-1]|uniref:Ubiquitin 3 binding protein But2 C-terminal domain-containing protein n=1 Tax=Choiromyces venosus 120613-1 TaxID=1336337 RepID=A0A3N4JI03_9PEZI|nr:hypothetical protein L873DRAFT_1076529 [Choiromyces venosus 120613-1]
MIPKHPLIAIAFAALRAAANHNLQTACAPPSTTKTVMETSWVTVTEEYIATLTPTTTTTTTSSLSSAPVFTPTWTPKPPITFPNNQTAISAYLQLRVDSKFPDTVIPETDGIGPDVYVAYDFDLTHAGKTCRFHFAIGEGDEYNTRFVQRVYPILSGSVDQNMTWNTRPSVGDPVAEFEDWRVLGIGETRYFRPLAPLTQDFPCPTGRTGWLVKGRERGGKEEEKEKKKKKKWSVGKRYTRWSWNRGLVIEVLGGQEWPVFAKDF